MSLTTSMRSRCGRTAKGNPQEPAWGAPVRESDECAGEHGRRVVGGGRARRAEHPAAAPGASRWAGKGGRAETARAGRCRSAALVGAWRRLAHAAAVAVGQRARHGARPRSMRSDEASILPVIARTDSGRSSARFTAHRDKARSWSRHFTPEDERAPSRRAVRSCWKGARCRRSRPRCSSLGTGCLPGSREALRAPRAGRREAGR